MNGVKLEEKSKPIENGDAKLVDVEEDTITGAEVDDKSTPPTPTFSQPDILFEAHTPSVLTMPESGSAQEATPPPTPKPTPQQRPKPKRKPTKPFASPAEDDDKDYPISTDRAEAISRWVREAPISIEGTGKGKKGAKKGTKKERNGLSDVGTEREVVEEEVD